MNQLTIQIPASLQHKLVELAKEDAISVDQFVSSAIAEKISALLTVRYLEDRAKRGSLKHFRYILEKVPDVEPDKNDRVE